MGRFAIKGLLSRKLRTALTAVAIVLGVAMISGTYVLTDSIDQAFERIFNDIRAGSNAVISGKSEFDLSDGSGVTEPTFDESLLPEVQALPAVAAAEGAVDSESTQLIGDDGKAVVYGGAPNLGFSIANPDSPFNPLTLVEGSWPGPNQVIVDKETASKEDFEVGEVIGVQAEGPVQRLEVSGIMQFSSGLTIGGATLAGFDLRTAQRLLRKEGQLDEIAIASKPDTTQQELLDQVNAILPPDTQVRTGQQVADDDAEGTNEFITFLRGFLLAFGGIALFVGSFVIANSLSITIAQRTREFATLRTLGASRRQVLGSILVEALVVGVVASVVGLFLGLLLARGLFGLFDLVGFTLPNTGLVFETRTAVVALSRGDPRHADREPAPGDSCDSRAADRRRAGGVDASARTVRPFPLARRGAHDGRRLRGARLRPLRQRPRHDADPHLDGARRAAHLPRGRALLLAPRPSARGAPRVAGHADGRSGRVPGARQRSPEPAADGVDGGRADDRARARDARRHARGRDRLVVPRSGQRPLHGRLRDHRAEQLLADPDRRRRGGGEGTGRARRRKRAHGRGASKRRRGLHHRGRPGDGRGHRHGLGRGLAGGHRARSATTARSSTTTTPKDNELGARLAGRGHVPERDQPRRSAIEGIFDPPTGGSPFAAVTISAAAWDAQVPNPRNLYSFLKMEGGATDENQAALDAALADFPNAKAQTRQAFIDNQISGLNSILNILYVLLALSIIVSLFGIVNTLVLTVFERTREIGMLRAIGMTRRQVRRMIRHESIITALIGATLGIALGIVLAALLIWRVDFIEFSFPTTQVIVFVIAAIVVGIVAAILPARRAAKLDPLEAIAYE